MGLQVRLWLGLAALSGLIAVAFGAFATHGVSDPHVKDLLSIAVEYQLIHALAVFACFSLYRAGARTAGIAAWLFLAGALLFSGSIYGLALTPARWFWPATPVGGLCFMAGWATLAWAGFAGTKSA
jgi:uncharacterized membrane protein YgdD (TMEM256/DUF423 family)